MKNPSHRQKKILDLCDGMRTSHEIASLCGDNAKYIQRTMLKYNAPRLRQAPPAGERNPSWKSGRKIDRDGYALVSAPPGHPYARKRKGRSYGVIYEHRMALEKKLGRYLIPGEVVDHIDGLRLHNDPDNLRLFGSNGDHLKATISGRVPQWSEASKRALRTMRNPGEYCRPVHKYDQMKKNGDAKLREILLAHIALEADSPYLLGTNHHLEKAGISDLSRSSLVHELEKLSRKYA